MKRKIIAILILVAFCFGSFSFAGEEDFPIALKISNKHFIVYDINEWK